MRARAVILIGVGLGVVATGAAAWRFDIAGRTFLTDGGAIREPAGRAPVRDVLWTPPAPLGLNTGDDEYEPRVSADGQTLFFVRGRAGHNTEIYSCRRTPEGWSEAAPLAGIDTADDELGPEPSADGRALYFASNRPGGAGGYDLWVSRREGDGWAAPENLSTVNTPDNEYNPALTPDGKSLYFSSNRPRAGERAGDQPAAWSATVRENIAGHDFDLYRATLDDGVVGAPEPVDPLNTPANEGTPAISPAGDFLYFSSDRVGGSGGFDLYRSRLGPGGPARPENLKSPINSDANELDPSLSMGGFALDFSSDRERPGRVAEARRDYDLFASVSREVYRVTDASSAARWAAMWRQVWPWLMWFLLSLLCILLFLLLWRAQRNKHLSLLTRCLIGSMLVHLLILFLLSLWGVTTSLGQLFHKPGGTKVRLASAGTGDALAMQVRGTAPLLPAAITVALPSEAPMMDAQPRLDPVETGAARSNPALLLMATAPNSAEAPAPTTVPAVSVEARPSAMQADVSVPAAAAPSSENETATMVTIENPSTPEPRTQTSAAPGTGIPLPAASPSAPISSLAGAASASDSGNPATTPARSASLEMATSAATQVAVPRDAAAGPVAEPTASGAVAPGPGPEPGLTIGSASPNSPGAPPTVGRAAPATGGTLAKSNPTELATPGPSVARSAELNAGTEGIDVALPRAAPTEIGAEAARERHEGAFIPAAQGVVDPGLRTAEGGLKADGPPAARSEVSPGASLAGKREAAEAQVLRDPASSVAASSTLSPADSAALDVALPTEAAPTQAAAPRRGMAEQQNSPASGPDLQPAPAIAREESRETGPAAARSAIGAGMSLAARTAAEPVEQDPQRDRSADAGPALSLNDAPATDLALPRDVAPPEDQFAQRDPETRLGLVERLGGSKETEAAVARSLAWLAAHQSADGRWASAHFDDDCRHCGGTTKIDSDRAVTGLALLCFMASDHTHTKDGPYRENVARALTWLKGQQKPNGDLRGEETMYSHGIATISLAEAYAMTKDQDLAGPVERAVAFIAGARNSSDGGWRYEPGEPGDTSVLGWQAMALASAKRAGLAVPEESLEAADRWLDQVSARSPGSYAYQPGMAPTQSMTAEGLYVRQLLGHGRDEELMRASVERVMRNPPKWNEQPSTYTWYYATLSLFQHGGPEWERWNEVMTAELLANQRMDGTAAGSWDPVDRWATIGGRVYQTTICTLTLEVYYRYLPMYAVEGGGAPGTSGGTPPSP